MKKVTGIFVIAFALTMVNYFAGADRMSVAKAERLPVVEGGAITISGSPVGAKFRIVNDEDENLKFEGVIPATITIPFGSYTIAVSHPGYYDQDVHIDYDGSAITLKKYWDGVHEEQLKDTVVFRLAPQNKRVDKICKGEQNYTQQVETIDLNDDGVNEYFFGCNFWSGSGEISLYVVRKKFGMYRMVNEFSVYTACVVSTETTNGYKDIQCYYDDNLINTFKWNGKNYGKTKKSN